MAKARKTAFLERARAGALELKRWTPITGIGRFDARLDVSAHKLYITLKCFHTFVNAADQPPWTLKEQLEYKRAVKTVIESTWTECYSLAVDKDDWRDVYAGVDVKVMEVPNVGSSHYTIEGNKVQPGSFQSGISRPNWTGRFTQYDIVPEDRAARDKGALIFKAKQVEDKLTSARAAFIPFDAGSSKLTTQAAVALNTLSTSLRTIFTKELSNSGYRIHCYGKTSRTEARLMNMTTGKNRAKAVADFLNQKLGFPVAAVVDSFDKDPWMRADLDKILSAANVSPAERTARNFQGCVLVTKDVIAGGAGVPTGIARNYTVVAHEAGHMFGLPDEYTGVNCLGLQEQIDLRTIVPQSMQNMTRLRVTPNSDVAPQAEGFAALLKRGNVPSPIFMESKSILPTSIMYAGPEVLPAHYLTFWEAMLTICYPYIWPGELKIVPNAAGSGKKSNIEYFAH